MPKFPVVGGADVIRALERLGFRVARQKGGHVTMRRGASCCVVPLHKELKIGTLIGLLKQAGISPEAFIEALRS